MEPAGVQLLDAILSTAVIGAQGEHTKHRELSPACMQFDQGNSHLQLEITVQMLVLKKSNVNTSNSDGKLPARDLGRK